VNTERALVAAAAAATLLLATPSNAATAPTTPQSKVAAVERHYKSGIEPNGGWGTWRVVRIGAAPAGERSTTIVVSVAIPDNNANEIMSRGSEEQRKAVGYTACPTKGSAVWEALAAGDDIQVEGLYRGKPFVDVSCRAYAVGVPRERTPPRATGAEPTKASESIYERNILQATTSDGLTNADLAWHALNTYGWDCDEVTKREPQRGEYFVITCRNGKKLRVYPRPGQHPSISNINGGFK
jgi:hypothetical protein